MQVYTVLVPTCWGLRWAGVFLGQLVVHVPQDCQLLAGPSAHALQADPEKFPGVSVLLQGIWGMGRKLGAMAMPGRLVQRVEGFCKARQGKGCPGNAGGCCTGSNMRGVSSAGGGAGVSPVIL